MLRGLVLLLSVLWTVPAAQAIESFCPTGSSPRADILFCEDWETYNPVTNASFPDTAGSTFNGWTALSDGRTDGHGYIQSTTMYNGTYALRQQREAGGNFVADIRRSFTSTTDFRMRFYVYFQSPYGRMGLDAIESNQHIAFLNTNASFTGVRFDIYSYMNIPDDDVASWATCGTSPTPPRDYEAHMMVSAHDAVKKGVLHDQPGRCFNIQDHYNEWLLVEWSHKWVSSSEARSGLWINGVEMMSNEHMGTPDSQSQNITSVILSGFMSNSTATEANIYFDNVVVSNDSSLTIGAFSGGGGGALAPRFNPMINLRR